MLPSDFFFTLVYTACASTDLGISPAMRGGASPPACGLLFFVSVFVCAVLSSPVLPGGVEASNATEVSSSGSGKEGSFADIIDRALQKEFSESEQSGAGS